MGSSTKKLIIHVEKPSRRVLGIGKEINQKIVFNIRREGKDIKSSRDAKGLAPSITINVDNEFDLLGQKITSLSKTAFGLGQNIIPFQIRSFKDFPDLDPVYFVKHGMPYEAFPFTYDSYQNNERYRELDTLSMDGVIEVFPIRKQKNITDIEISGIKGSIGSGDFIRTSNSTLSKKGASLIEEKEEIGNSRCEYFQDSQEILFSHHNFPNSGQNSNRKLSQSGFTNNSKYYFEPYKEKNIFEENYTHVGFQPKNNLLSNSSRNVSEIGYRFKIFGNGLIMNQFEKVANQKKLGTDSIAFAGLHKG